MAAATTIAALSGFGHGASSVREILHLLHQLGHELYKLGEDLLDDDDDDSKGEAEMTTLGEAPGGPVLIEALTKAIADFSLLYAGTPDRKALPHLESYIGRIEPTIIEAVGAGPAKIILEAFASAVIGEKHRHEANGASRA
jgi:hypothetical protein